MALHDKGQELVERDERDLNERFRQLHKDGERDDEELAHLDQLIREAEQARDGQIDNGLASA